MVDRVELHLYLGDTQYGLGFRITEAMERDMKLLNMHLRDLGIACADTVYKKALPPAAKGGVDTG